MNLLLIFISLLRLCIIRQPYQSETNDGIIMPRESRAMKSRQRFTAFDLVIKDVMLLHKDIQKGKKECLKIFLNIFHLFSRVGSRLRGVNKSSKIVKCVIIKFLKYFMVEVYEIIFRRLNRLD